MTLKNKFDSSKTVFIIDGSSFLYRAYYGLKPLHTPQGMPVQAVYGFCRMVKKIIDIFHPRYMTLVWDSKGKTERHELYAEYKATRQAPPSNLFEQKEHIIEFANLIGLKQVAQTGIEADDLMYSLARDQAAEGFSIVMVTSDKDMGQALDENIVMYDTFKDLLIDRHKFNEIMGFDHTKLPFYYALVGDSSDNIPGVKGIGKKGAYDLVQQFFSLDDLYANLDTISQKRLKNALQEDKANAFLSRDLFLLRYHKLSISTADIAFDPEHWNYARAFFENLNFKSLITSSTDVPSTVVSSSYAYERYVFITVDSEEKLLELCKKIQESKGVAVDTEGYDLRPRQGTLVGISFCVEVGVAYYLPLAHEQTTSLSYATAITYLKPLLEDAKIPKYLQHAKFDMHVFAQAGIELQGVIFDTMLAAHLLARDGDRIGLKDLSMRLFNEQMLTFAEVVTQAGYKNFAQVPLERATQYAAADAHQTLKLYILFHENLESIPSLKKAYYDIEMPLMHILYAMEYEGIEVTVNDLKQLDVKVSKALVELEDQIIESAGQEYAGINLNSPRQVEKLLFEHLKLPPQKKSGKGTSYSTDQEVLKILSTMHVVPGYILTYRELAKLKSTYIEALPHYVVPTTHRIHTTFSQTAVATGRLASSEPNLQNIPTGTGYGLAIRAAFKAKKGYTFISADYSQIELRILAYYSQDSALLRAFNEGHDIHAETASRLFDVNLHEVTHEQRQIGKRINFSILYGLTPYGLSKDLGISFGDAKKYIDRYFSQYPQVSLWMESVIDFVKKHGYVETLYGRRRYIAGIYEKNKTLYDEARRVAINTCAQGTAAELVKIGMIQVFKMLQQKYSDKAHILLQIHDELIIEVQEDKAQEVAVLLQKQLESIVSWNVPLVITTRVGTDWAAVSK